MPTPLPGPDAVDLSLPDAGEVLALSRGLQSAVTTADGLSRTQRLFLVSLVPAMTAFPASLDGPPISAGDFARALAARDLSFRGRIVQLMVLLALVLRPLPEEVAERVR